MTKKWSYSRSIRTYVLLLLISIPHLLEAQTCASTTCYVTPTGGSGTRDGTNWTKALSKSDIISGLNQTTPSSKLTRGTTYFIAGGSYGSIAIDDPISGTQWIRLIKATEANSGSVAGWQASFAQQAVFGSVIFATSYIEFNGQVRNENQWNDGASYGFQVGPQVVAHWDNYRQDSSTHPVGGDFITIKYTNIGNQTAGGYVSSLRRGVEVVGGGGSGRHDWVVSSNYIHHTREAVHFTANCYNIVVDKNYIGPSWGKEAIMALFGGWSFTVSNNILVDNCQDVPDDDTANGCTTEISGWGNDSGLNFDNWQVFGNIITRVNAKDTAHTDATIFGGAAAVVKGWKVYNNVISGFGSGSLQRASIVVNGTAEVYNNLWYDIGPSSTVACTASTCSNNWCYTGSTSVCGNMGTNSILGNSSPFQAGTFKLLSNSNAKNAGKNLTSAVGFEGGRVDPAGNVRGADGAWDIGAYEASGGTISPPGAPTSLRVQ